MISATYPAKYEKALVSKATIKMHIKTKIFVPTWFSPLLIPIHIMVVFAPFSLQLLEKCYRKLIILVICASFVSIFIAKHHSIQGYLEKYTTNSILVPREYNYTDINPLTNVTREWISQKRIRLRSNNYWVLYNHIRVWCSILAPATSLT